MSEKGLNPNTKTGRIHLKIFELLKNNPEGMRWVDLAEQVQDSDQSIHPKTLNGCIWKLTTTFPDKIYKPEKGIFKLKNSSN
jgi:hypothetical protein